MHHHLLFLVTLCFLLTLSLDINPVIAARNSINSHHPKTTTATTTTNVEYKDDLYSPELNLSVRLYLPKNTTENQKLPLLVYYHGGAFVTESPFSPNYHNFLSVLVSEADVICVSVEYRLANVCPLPCAYNDSWNALKWIASHLNGDGPEDWLNEHADFQRVFVSGDSAGANIAHQMTIKLGVQETLEGFNVTGLILAHPFFWGGTRLPGETPIFSIGLGLFWKSICPGTTGVDDPLLNPAEDPNLARVAFSRLQVFVSEKDQFQLRERGWYYAQKLRYSGWSGHQEVIDFQGDGHVFHMDDLTSANAITLRKRMVAFIYQAVDTAASDTKNPSLNWSNI